MHECIRVISSCAKLCSNSSLSMSTRGDIAVSTEEGVQIISLCARPFDSSDVFSVIVTQIPSHDNTYNLNVGTPPDQLPTDFKFTAEGIIMRYTRSLQLRTSSSNRGVCLSRWSPLGLDTINRSVLMVLSLDFKLTLFSRRSTANSWHEECCLSDELLTHMTNKNYYEQRKESDSHKAYQHKANTVSTTVFAWNSELFDDPSGCKFGRLVTGTRGGHVILWKINSLVNSISACIEHVVVLPDDVIICSLCWCTTKHNTNYVVVGCANGCLFSINLDGYAITQMWCDTDDVRITQIIWLKELDVLVCGKGVYLLLLPGCDGSNLHAVGLQCVSTKLPIVALEVSSSDRIYIATAIGSVSMGRVLLHQNAAPSVEIEALNLKLPDVLKMSCRGFTLSPNFMFMILVSSPWENYCHLRMKDPVKLHIVNLTSEEHVTRYLTSPSLGNIQEMTDVLLCEKYFKSIDQSWPEISNKLDKVTSMSTLQVKILRCIVQIKLGLNPKATTEQKDEMRSLLDILSERIIVDYIVGSLTQLTLSQHKSLTQIEFESICLQCQLLCKLYPNDIEKMELIKKVKSATSKQYSDISETCHICTANITEIQLKHVRCPNGHVFARCVQTMLSCHILPYRICGWCGQIAKHKETDVCGWLSSLQTNYCTLCDGTLAS